MFAMAFRIVAIVLMLVAVVFDIIGGAGGNLLQAFRDGGFAAFIASFLF